jgi:hypothetical protein
MNRHDVPTMHLRAAGQGRLPGSVGAGLRFDKRWAFEGLVAPAVVMAIFGALSLAWRNLVVLNDPPS